MADDDNDVGLPQKGLNQIVKEVIPDMRIANESRELLNACCVEFVKHVARAAQNISATDQRKTIYHEHVRKALWNLQFPPDYVEAADSVLSECKVAAEKKLRRKNSRLDKCGIPEAELYEMQQRLIEQARQDQLAAAAAAAQSSGEGGSTPSSSTAAPSAPSLNNLFPAPAGDDDEYDT